MRASESPGHNEVLGPKVPIPRAERCVYLHPHWDFSFDSSSSRKEVDLAAITTGGGGGGGVGGDALQPECFLIAHSHSHHSDVNPANILVCYSLQTIRAVLNAKWC